MHFLDARGGVQGVVPERGLYPRRAPKARQAWHFLDNWWVRGGCSLSAASIHDALARRGGRCISSTSHGVRRGWFPISYPQRKECIITPDVDYSRAWSGEIMDTSETLDFGGIPGRSSFQVREITTTSSRTSSTESRGFLRNSRFERLFFSYVSCSLLQDGL